MREEELLGLTALELGEAIQKGRTTAPEAVGAVLAQIERTEELYHCYVTLNKKGALEEAERVQRRIEAGQLKKPLAGVPMAVKDNICTRGLRTTCASRLLENFIPSYSAEAVMRLEAAGAVMLGKTNMDEFAMGSTTETSAYGSTINPRNLKHVPGGSSGGSAAAVAAGECFFALGSDTGGSIRQPAAYCGVVGMKPTYGTVSRYGLVAYGSSLEQIGPITRSVADCAAVLEVLAARDEKDSTSVQRTDTEFTAALKRGAKGLRIGIPHAYFGEGNDAEVQETVQEAAGLLKRAGAEIEEFELNLTELAVPTYYTIADAEASSNLARFDGVRFGCRAKGAESLRDMYRKTRSQGFGAEVKRRIMLGSFVLSSGYYEAYYQRAQRVRTLIKQEFDRAFERFDCILSPTAPTTAPRLGESLKEPLKMYLGDIYTVSANLAGLPAVSVPCGTDREGLPIGMQLMADCFEEEKLLRAAYAYERLRKEAADCGEEENRQ